MRTLWQKKLLCSLPEECKKINVEYIHKCVCLCPCAHTQRTYTQKNLQQSEKYVTQQRWFYGINGTHRWADYLWVYHRGNTLKRFFCTPPNTMNFMVKYFAKDCSESQEVSLHILTKRSIPTFTIITAAKTNLNVTFRVPKLRQWNIKKYICFNKLPLGQAK